MAGKALAVVAKAARATKQLQTMEQVHSLTAVERQEVLAMTVQFGTKLSMIDKMLNAGLTTAEARETLETRELVTASLRSIGEAQFNQSLSVSTFLQLRTLFPELPTDPDAAAERLLTIHDDTQHIFFSIVLAKLIAMREKDGDMMLEACVENLLTLHR